MMEAALDAGAEDIVKDGLAMAGHHRPVGLRPGSWSARGRWNQPTASADLTMIPKSTIAPTEADARRLLKLIDALEDNDDVQEVFANFDISEEMLEAVAV